MNQVVSIAPLWARIVAGRRAILLLVASATIVTAAIAFLLPPWYRAETELLPPSEEESGMSLSSLLRGMAVPGIKIPTQVTPADVFLAILESRRIGTQMVERFDLKTLYKRKYMEDALKELKRHSQFELTQAGTVKISVEDRDRRRASDMASAYVEFLDRFNREVRITKGRRTRMFIEGRLVETKAELASSERRLTEYQSRHKAVALTPEMSSAIEQAANLFARRTALNVRLGVVQSYSAGSDDELQIRQELEQLDRQLRQLPETGIQLARLVRDVKAFEQVFVLLTAQYEDARIAEARDVVTVEVLDVAQPPEKKSRPQRSLMILAAMVLSLAIGIVYAITREPKEARPAIRAVAAN